ncbi:hypothetical protein [Gottfriedia solisilvae]|uniref:hypothetical protein n=1 Tax=Gottfriedia solisilvae TaxID=1516104 RepID=UPI003D2F4F9C
MLTPDVVKKELITLQTYDYSFDVFKGWLSSKLKERNWNSIEDFLDNYVWDDSQEILHLAFEEYELRQLRLQ